MNEQPLYLIMVTENDNHNKYYRLTPKGDTFTAEWGRIGYEASAQSQNYPISMWDKKLHEKLRKGYVDQTKLFKLPTISKKDRGYLDISIKSIAEIVNRLQSFAKQNITENYTISSAKVSPIMIEEAQSLIDQISANGDINHFNDLLLVLFRTIPRKMDKVVNYLATSKGDYSSILQREQDLLDVMRGQVVQQQADVNIEDNSLQAKQTILETLGLQIYEINSDDERIIKGKLDDLSNKFKNAWKVINLKTQVRFDKFVAENHIKNNKLLWHGSKNENWWSIIQSGLVLRPNAAITGKMFGEGIYFAPLARKSFGYTSYSGSYWARGNSPFGFMSLFDTAYGEPYNVYNSGSFHSFNYNKLQQTKPGANCLHAHAGQMLRNDEIVYYQENQITIKYLVELN